MSTRPYRIDPIGSVSVSVKKEEVLYIHTLTYNFERIPNRQFWTFSIYFVDVKTSDWALTETLPIVYYSIQFPLLAIMQ